MAKRKSMNVDSSIDNNVVGAFGVVGDGEPGDQQEETTKYTVTYEYDTNNNDVLATLPNDDNEYEDGATVTALAPSQTSVEGTNNDKTGTFTFNGWDAETKTVNGANVTFTGTWTFTESSVDPTPDPTKYYVTYSYDGVEDNAVLATLPNDDTGYDDGATVTALNPSQTSVEGTNGGKSGTWTFVSWDEATKTVNGANVTFTGTWTFTESTPDPGPTPPTPGPEPEPDPTPDPDEEPEIKIYPNDRFDTRSTQKDEEIQAIYGRTDLSKRSTVGEMIGKIVNINTDTTIDGKEIPSYIEGLPMKVIDVFGENVLVAGANSRAEAKYLYLVAAEDVSEVEEEEEKEPDDGE